VIVVFTQYDILVKEVRDDYVGRNLDRILAGELSRETQKYEIKNLIDAKFKKMKKEWEPIIPIIDVGIVFLSNPSGKHLNSNPGLAGKQIFTKSVPLLSSDGRLQWVD